MFLRRSRLNNSDMSSSTSNHGVGFGSLLTLLFIALKLTNVIDWSWWWVLSPIWIGAIIAIIFFVVFTLLWKRY